MINRIFSTDFYALFKELRRKTSAMTWWVNGFLRVKNAKITEEIINMNTYFE